MFSKKKKKVKSFVHTREMCNLLRDIDGMDYMLNKFKDTKNFSVFQYSTVVEDTVEFDTTQLKYMQLTKRDLFEMLSRHLKHKINATRSQLINMGGK